MPYVIESIKDPRNLTESDVTQWTIEINYYDIQNDSNDHYEVISVYGSTLDLCLLRAKSICDILNTTKFKEAVITLDGFYNAKDNS